MRARRKDLYSFTVGQSVGAVIHETSVRDIMYNLQLEFGEAMERLAKFL